MLSCLAVPYRTSWLAAGRRLLAPFGRESAAGQFAGVYADLHATAVIFPEAPDAMRALARHARIAVIANADHDYLMRCLHHNGLRLGLVVDSETARCYKPDLAGLVDWRADRARPVRGRIDERIVDALQQAVSDHAASSTRTASFYLWRTREILVSQYGPDTVPMPARATFYRLFERVTAGQHS